jgi:hypothetical protein
MKLATPAGPRRVVAELESAPVLPPGIGERFSGYSVAGVTFASGHLLALRRFPASSIGPAYTSVWHRTPTGEWTLYTDVEPGLACGRYFGGGGTRTVEDEIRLNWLGEFSFTVGVPTLRLAWAVHLRATWPTRLLSMVAPCLPDALWCRTPLRRGAAAITGRALRIGALALDGVVPCGQRFSLEPRRIWVVDASTARIGGHHLGPPVLPHVQERLGDFWIPRWGLFMVGHTAFGPGGACTPRKTRIRPAWPLDTTNGVISGEATAR